MGANTEITSSPRNSGLDLIKCLAIFLVIVVHAAAPYFVNFGQRWYSALTYQSIAHICVPLFFMVTGALLIPKETTIKSTGIRIKKVLIPLVAWSVIYLAFDKYYLGESTSNWIVRIIQGPPVKHLWFIYALIGVYIFMPLLSRFYSSSTRQEKIWILSAWGIGSSILPTYKSIYGTSLTEVDLSILPIYCGYVIAGAFLSDEIKSSTKHNKLAYLLLFVTGVSVTFALTLCISIKHNKYSSIFIEYSSPTVLLATIGAFGYIIISSRETRKLPRVVEAAISYIGRQTLGIYMSHMIPLIIFFNIMNGRDGWFVWSWILVASIVAMILSILMVYTIQKIPFIRHICPK